MGNLPLGERQKALIHRFTENLQEAVDKLWKGVAVATPMGLEQSCSNFNQPMEITVIYPPRRLTVLEQQGRVQTCNAEGCYAANSDS